MGSFYKIHHYHLTALSLTGGNFKEQPGTELTKITQQLNFERPIETQNRLGWKEHLVHNYMLFFYKIG